MELEINGVKADIRSNDISITRKTLDIQNPELRFIDVTNSFKLPWTDINREIFFGSTKVNSTSDAFERKYIAKIIDQFVIFNGYGILTNVSENESFEFQLVDKSKDLFNKLDQSITNDTWDDYDFINNTTNKATLKTEDIDNPICWPDVIYHKKKISANTGLAYSRPCLYLSGVLNIKLEALGYSFTNPLKLAINLNADNFLFTSYQKTLNQTVTDGNFIIGLDSTDMDIDVTLASNSIRVDGQKTRFRIRGDITHSDTSDKYLIVTGYDSTAGTTETQYFFINRYDTAIDFITGDFQSDNLTMMIKFQITGGDVTFVNTLLYSLIDEKDRTDLDTNPFDGYYVKVLDNLPDITYKDIYRLMCITTNSVHVIDSLTKEFSFTSFSGLSKLRSLDWSDRFIMENAAIDNDVSGFAKSNLLTFSNDETVPSRLGWDSFETDGDNLEDEKEYLNIPFSASKEVSIGSQNYVSIDIYEDTQRIPDRTLNTRIFTVDSGVSYFSTLDWKNLKAIYEGLFDSLYQIRHISCQMNLKKLDVLGWDLVKLVYIARYGRYFIIEEIDDFIAGAKTDVKLLRYGR